MCLLVLAMLYRLLDVFFENCMGFVMSNEFFEDLCIEVQHIFRQAPAVLVGSGFSCGYGLPGMGVLGEHLSNNIESRLNSISAKNLWMGVLEDVKKNLEAGLNTISQGADGRDEVVSTIRQVTAEFIMEANASAEKAILEQSDVDSHAPVRLLRNLFNGAPQNAEYIPVITTNYDTLLELFCDLAAVPLDTGFTGLRRRRPRSAPIFQTNYSRVWVVEKKGPKKEHRPCKVVRLHKPHGSISWLDTVDGPIEVFDGYSKMARAIVVPGPSKYQDALVNVLFDAMRTEMNSVISMADALLCIGFGFNDDHLQGVIKSRLDNKMPMILLTRSATENIESILKMYPHVIAFFRKENGGSICRWLGKSVSSDRDLWALDDFLKNFIE